jgi:hypothetical protein
MAITAAPIGIVPDGAAGAAELLETLQLLNAWAAGDESKEKPQIDAVKIMKRTSFMTGGYPSTAYVKHCLTHAREFYKYENCLDPQY